MVQFTGIGGKLLMADTPFRFHQFKKLGRLAHRVLNGPTPIQVVPIFVVADEVNDLIPFILRLIFRNIEQLQVGNHLVFFNPSTFPSVA